MNTSSQSNAQLPLGRTVAYPSYYDPSLLFPIPRSRARAELDLTKGAALPFGGYDRWQLFELSWLDARGKPQVASATLWVPCTSPCLIESKSLKLYLNSLNACRFASRDELAGRIVADLSAAASTQVQLRFELPSPSDAPAGEICLDDQELEITHYGPPRADFLSADGQQMVQERLGSKLLKSNCPVTGQPDWASVSISYRGPQLDRAGLLRYLVSFRDHAEFHEQCVERIFMDIRQRCAPVWLWVEARYTRRGGLDINPWRASPNAPTPDWKRDLRQ